MKEEYRKRMIKEGHVRSLYGGCYEVFVPIGMLLLIVILWCYFVGREGASLMAISFSIPVLMLLFVACISRYKVARVHLVGEACEEEFEKIKEACSDEGCAVIGVGRHYLELRENVKCSNKFFKRPAVHTTIVYYEGRIYASAFRFADQTWHYDPFFFGGKELSKIKSLIPLV